MGAARADLLRLLPGYDPFRDAKECGAWFDTKKAQAALDFIRLHVRHVEGALAGTSLHLEEWQAAFTANLFGWMVEDTSGRVVRRYREALLYVPRKNGKTPLAAALALYVFFVDDEAGQQDYLAAADREQAGLLFRQCKGMVERDPTLIKSCRIYGGNASAGQSRSLYRDSDGSYLRVISADGDVAHGGNSHLVIVDELHAQPDRELVDVLSTSTASLNRAQPLTLYLTTADYQRPSICNEKHDYARKVMDGIIPDARFLPCVYEAPLEADWTSEQVWAGANPNLGVSVSIDYLRRECQKAKENPALENVFRRLHLNTKTEQDIRAIDMPRWDACGRRHISPADFEGQCCWCGLDLSTTTDLTAFAKVFRVEDGYATLLRFWAPKEKARLRSRRDGVPYDQWAAEGWLTLTPGDVVDYEQVRRDILADSQVYDIREIAADRWNATQIITQLMGDGLEVIAFGQGYASMTAPTKELLALIAQEKLWHGSNPILRWMASVFSTEQDAAGNLKPSKKKSTDRIDGLVAVTMALGRAMLAAIEAEPTFEMW